MARSDMAHMIMWSDSGMSEMKSQNVSCADGGLGVAAVGFHFDGMNQVGKLDRILNKEDRDIIADEIEIAFLGIEFDGKTADIARQIDGTRAARDR